MVIKKEVLYLLSLLFLCLIACSDNEGVYPNTETSFIVLSDDEVSLGVNGRYYEVEVICEDSVKVWVEEDWIELSNQKICKKNEILEFYVQRNDNEDDRECEIIFQSFLDSNQTKALLVKQKGTACLDNNAIEGGLISDFRLGYGYNIFQEYESERSMTEPVLDYDMLLKAEEMLGYAIIQEDKRSYEDIEYFSGYTLEELSEKLTKSSETTTKGWLGATKTVKKYAESKESHTLNEECYGYARLKKITASRYLDEGALEYLINEGEKPFSDGFMELYETICKNCQTEDINQLLKVYGSHVVIAADLGGMVEYMVDFKKSEVLNVETYTEITSKYVFGKETSSQAIENIKKSFSSSYSASKALTVIGGDEQHIQVINDCIRDFTNDSQLPQTILAEWMNALEGDYIKDDSLRKRLAVVGCNIVPIWLLFKDKAIQSRIIDAANEKAKKYALTTENVEIKGSRYCVSITQDMLDFKDDGNSDSSLVRIVYANKEPIFEICNEYVPQIRQDKRINILYPIVNGRPNISAGLYLGEGGNGKNIAYVAFADDKVMVLPISKNNEYKGKIYYINGALYLTDMGAGVTYLSDNQIQCTQSTYGYERYPSFYSGRNYPLVKIGSNYWYRTAETVVSESYNGFHYTNFWSLRWELLYEGDSSMDALSLPEQSDFKSMLSFLYGDVESLFIGQLSGFDAVFAGMISLKPQDGENGVIPGSVYGENVEYFKRKSIMPCNGWNQYFAITSEYQVEEGRLYERTALPSRCIRPKDYKYSKLE